MIDRPVIGELGRTDAHKTSRVEVLGELTEAEWAEFIACLKECAARFEGRITLKERTSRVPINVLRLLPRRKKARGRKKKRRPG